MPRTLAENLCFCYGVYIECYLVLQGKIGVFFEGNHYYLGFFMLHIS